MVKFLRTYTEPMWNKPCHFPTRKISVTGPSWHSLERTLGPEDGNVVYSSSSENKTQKLSFKLECPLDFKVAEASLNDKVCVIVFSAKRMYVDMVGKYYTRRVLGIWMFSKYVVRSSFLCKTYFFFNLWKSRVFPLFHKQLSPIF